ncbi:hypothetical protein PSBY109024_00135 [Pseudoalteromonas byunsanensis]
MKIFYVVVFIVLYFYGVVVNDIESTKLTTEYG